MIENKPVRDYSHTKKPRVSRGMLPDVPTSCAKENCNYRNTNGKCESPRLRSQQPDADCNKLQPGKIKALFG